MVQKETNVIEEKLKLIENQKLNLESKHAQELESLNVKNSKFTEQIEDFELEIKKVIADKEDALRKGMADFEFANIDIATRTNESKQKLEEQVLSQFHLCFRLRLKKLKSTSLG